MHVSGVPVERSPASYSHRLHRVTSYPIHRPGWADLTAEEQAAVLAEGPYDVLPPHEAKAKAYEEKAERKAWQVRCPALAR